MKRDVLKSSVTVLALMLIEVASDSELLCDSRTPYHVHICYKRCLCTRFVQVRNTGKVSEFDWSGRL